MLIEFICKQKRLFDTRKTYSGNDFNKTYQI